MIVHISNPELVDVIQAKAEKEKTSVVRCVEELIMKGLEAERKNRRTKT